MKGILKSARFIGEDVSTDYLIGNVDERTNQWKSSLKRKSKEKPTSLAKYMLTGAGAGALTGGAFNLLTESPVTSPMAPTALAITGASIGALGHLFDRASIKESKRLSQMTDEELKREFVRTHRERQRAKALLAASQEFRKAMQSDRKHNELLSAINSRGRSGYLEYSSVPRETKFQTRTLGAKSGVGKRKPTGVGRVSFRKR